MACPYFFPTERLEADLWPHRRRLPLGDGWRGRCTAGDRLPGEDELKEFCNLGYAKACPFLPSQRSADAVRFGVRQVNGCIAVTYICERDHKPGESGELEFDLVAGAWTARHNNPCIQRMAECVLSSKINIRLSR
jgi:hypothetical protein